MPGQAKRVYNIDSGPYQELIREFLSSVLVDANYGVAMAKSATTIKTKREQAAQLKADRERARQEGDPPE